MPVHPHRIQVTLLLSSLLRVMVPPHYLAYFLLPFLILLTAVSACSGFRTSQGPQLRLEEVHLFGARRIAFRPAGDRLASGGQRGDVRIWSIPAGESLGTLEGHGRPVSGLAWLDDDHLVSADTQGKLRIWNATAGEILNELRTERITSLALLPSPERIVVGHATGRLRVYSWPDLTLLAETGLQDTVLSVAIEPQRQWIVVATDDRRVQLFNGRLARLRELQTPPGKSFELRFSPDGQQIAGGGWFRIFLWSTASGALELRDAGHFGAVASLDYSPDGQRLASIGRITCATVEITDVATGQLERRLSPQPLCGWHVRFSPDGRYVATSSEDGSVTLYDMTLPYRPTWRHD
jgi:WD40 repeat protein